MTTKSEAEGAEVDDIDDLPGITATLQRLVDNGLGPALGLSPDWLRRSSIARVTRLGPEELARRLDLIYSAHRGSFIGYASQILGNRDDAEDVVNEAFARILRADPDLHAPEALTGYVRSVVRNEARDRGGQNAQDRASREPPDLGELDERLVAPDRAVEDRVCEEISLGIALHVLSERQRQCFALRFLHGLSVRDTALRMNISDGNVKRLCHDIRCRLAALLLTD